MKTSPWAIGTAIVATLMVYRRWHTRWGATPDEVDTTLPGDEIEVPPGMTATRAITIGAPPEAVWPWLVQIGGGKAGWYSYDWLDNLGRPSAQEILPQWQDVAVGDPAAQMNAFAPPEASVWEVAAVAPNETLLWRSPDATWVWSLTPLPGGATRLVTRIRVGYRLPLGLVFGPLLEVADFPMMRKELLGIKARAERAGVAQGRSASAAG